MVAGCTVGITVQPALIITFLRFIWAAVAFGGLLSGYEDLFCKEHHIHIIKVIPGLQSKRIDALDLTQGN